MGFESRDITVALETAGFSMTGALNLQMHGLETTPVSPRAKAAEARAKRRTARQVDRASLDPILRSLIPAVFPQYLERARARFGGQSFQVCDLGMHAGTRTDACFWLSFVAGWSHCVFSRTRIPAVPRQVCIF